MEPIIQTIVLTASLCMFSYGVFLRYGFFKLENFSKANPINKMIAENVMSNQARIDNEEGKRIHDMAGAKKKTYGMMCDLDKPDENNVIKFRLYPQFRLNGAGHYS